MVFNTTLTVLHKEEVTTAFGELPSEHWLAHGAICSVLFASSVDLCILQFCCIKLLSRVLITVSNPILLLQRLHFGWARASREEDDVLRPVHEQIMKTQYHCASNLNLVSLYPARSRDPLPRLSDLPLRISMSIDEELDQGEWRRTGVITLVQPEGSSR